MEEVEHGCLTRTLRTLKKNTHRDPWCDKHRAVKYGKRTYETLVFSSGGGNTELI